MEKNTAVGSECEVIIVPGNSIPSQPWWPELHLAIIEAFLTIEYSVFPPTWTRLDPEPDKGARGLAQELGDHGHIAVAFTEDHHPVACGGILPFRGEHWIYEAGTKHEFINDGDMTKTGADDISDSNTLWEICCFCVHPSARGRGISHQLLNEIIKHIKVEGATSLVAHYAVDETGDFWTRLGFEAIPGADSTLPKGFQTDPEKEDLRADIHFKMGARQL